MIPENARESKNIVQKMVKNSLEIQQTFLLFSLDAMVTIA
jgi:hypothetical protein